MESIYQELPRNCQAIYKITHLQQFSFQPSLYCLALNSRRFSGYLVYDVELFQTWYFSVKNSPVDENNWKCNLLLRITSNSGKILFLHKEPVFPFLMLIAKQGNYWYHFYNVFGMTRSLTGDGIFQILCSYCVEHFSPFYDMIRSEMYVELNGLFNFFKQMVPWIMPNSW